MIEIYKKLPKTNCGKCGESTCIAFALKVSKSQAHPSDCPFLDEVKPQGNQQKGDRISESSYESVCRDLEREAISVDFREAAQAVGGTYESRDGREAVRIMMLKREYEMRKEGLFEDGVYCRDSWAKICIYDYLRRKGTTPLTGNWIALGHFPHTASHVKAFQSNAEKKIVEVFKRDLPGLKKRCRELGGGDIEGRLKADYTCSFNLLPTVPLYLSFWAADEEFDPDCKIVFDSNAESHIDIEYLANLLERFTQKLTASE